jgi:hypothetical protein
MQPKVHPISWTDIDPQFTYAVKHFVIAEIAQPGAINTGIDSDLRTRFAYAVEPIRKRDACVKR